ncbi:HD domain-containing protein [Trueperella pyogenes]|uniref:HD domain-containing protein n=1 Tax=Trueperella pyogenes TaxID=1661 RepID=UPI00345D84C0
MTATPDFEAAKVFLFKHLAASRAAEGAKRYRYEHCLRVARIGRRVAQAAGLDVAALELGCLLHDIGKYDAAIPVDHGRAGALVVKDYFAQTGFTAPVADEIVQGIAMHVDGRCNPRDDEGTDRDAAGRPYLTFVGEPSVLAKSIGDCDNIDRFSTYRIADTLRYVDFMNKTTAQQREFAADYLNNLRQQYDYACSTTPAHEMWIANLDHQWEFFTKLQAELG